MACPKCAINPYSHNFIHFANMEDKKLYYTAPAKAIELVKSEDDFQYLKIHLDKVKTPWIWVFDCTAMTFQHYTNIGLIKKLFFIVENEQKEILKEVWVLFPNIWIRGIVEVLKGIMNSELLNRIKFYDGNKFEMFMKMEKSGLKRESFTTLHNIISQPYYLPDYRST